MYLERQRIADSLRQKLVEAQDEYRRATIEYKRLMSIHADMADTPAQSDGLYAMRRALAIHKQALRNFEKSLKAFNDFVLDGKLPPTE
jgi:hypothetical protein